ncbi:hypothetical protein ACFSQ3_04505 [Sphingobacterium corticis]|uniref:Uncharacterized protein n=1 Tax=Sphingobacterium corticis TaxID=1812823 RepID=A0ABW5NH58_9SPHI
MMPYKRLHLMGQYGFRKKNEVLEGMSEEMVKFLSVNGVHVI